VVIGRLIELLAVQAEYRMPSAAASALHGLVAMHACSCEAGFGGLRGMQRVQMAVAGVFAALLKPR
jgi:hypothetical protein